MKLLRKDSSSEECNETGLETERNRILKSIRQLADELQSAFPVSAIWRIRLDKQEPAAARETGLETKGSSHFGLETKEKVRILNLRRSMNNYAM